jgi:cytoskeletal protein RodZ
VAKHSKKQEAKKAPAWLGITLVALVIIIAILIIVFQFSAEKPAPAPAASGSGSSTAATVPVASDSGTASNPEGNITLPVQVVVDVDVDCIEAIEGGSKLAAAAATDGKMFTGKVAVKEGENLLEALKATGLVVVTTDSAAGIFVDSIAGLKSGDSGPTSGWTYTLNGETPSVSIDSIIPKEGDVLVFKYVASF